jgi:hypothetical protein
MFENKDFNRYVSLLIFVETDLVPFVLMTVATTVTVRRLFVSRNNVEKSQNKSSRERKMKDVKFAINSTVLNVLAVIFLLPITMSNLFSFQDPIEQGLFYTTCLFLLYFNFSNSFFIHFAFNSIFRSELFLALRIRKTKILASNTNAVDTVKFAS